MALWSLSALGPGAVLPVEDLRRACLESGIYDRANFAQDMTKDARLFESVRDAQGKRVGWRLTEAGRAAAEELASA